MTIKKYLIPFLLGGAMVTATNLALFSNQRFDPYFLNFTETPQQFVNTEEITQKSIEEFRKTVVTSLIPGLLINSKLEFSGVFLYSTNYHERYLLYSDISSIQPVTTVTGDILQELILDYHFSKTCFIQNFNNFPDDSGLRNRLVKAYKLSQYNYLLTCPIYDHTTDRLEGYVANVLIKDTPGVVIHLQALKVLTYFIEREFNATFN